MPATLSVTPFTRYVAFHPDSHQDSAVSIEAQALSLAEISVAESMERSIALFGPKAAALSELEELMNECAQPGWDGENAAPLSGVAAIFAAQLIRVLPDDVRPPELAPETDGAISLDWIRSKNRLVSLSVGAGPRLPYAWLDGGEKGHGVALFDGERFPPRVLEVIRAISEDGRVTVWAV